MAQTSTGTPGKITLLAGRSDADQVDFGTLAAGASATFTVVVTPGRSGPLTVAVAALDAAKPHAQPTSGDNLAFIGGFVFASVGVRTFNMPTPTTIQVGFDAAVPRTQAENLAN